MTTEEIKSAIAKTEKRIESPILDESAKKALKEKLRNFKSELEKLEGKVEEDVKTVSKKTKSAEKKVKKVAEKVESKAKRSSEEIKAEIEKLEKKLKNPIIDKSAKETIREKLESVKKELSGIEGKKSNAKKSSAGEKTKEVESPKSSKKSAAKEDEETVVINGKKLSVEDCTQILKEYSTSRKKAKQSKKKSLKRSTATRVAANVVQAIDTAIESVPSLEISENPTREINKFKKLKETGEEFLPESGMEILVDNK